MRGAAIDALTDYAATHPDLMLLTADLGYSVLERFASTYPDRYFNVGVCEQAMAGIAAGLALTGKQVVIYSIANFPTLRCLEQLRNDVCSHKLPVTVIAVGGGLAYGAQGYTHHGIEDIGIMAMLPDMCIASPADAHEARALMPQLLDRRGPAYLRLGRAGEPLVHAPDARIELGRATRLRCGTDIALLVTGPLLARAVEAADRLAARGISASLYSFGTILPIDRDAILAAAQSHRAILTVEEHLVDGGFGSRVGEVILDGAVNVRFGKYGIDRSIAHLVGSREWLIDHLPSIEMRAGQLL